MVFFCLLIFPCSKQELPIAFFYFTHDAGKTWTPEELLPMAEPLPLLMQTQVGPGASAVCISQ